MAEINNQTQLPPISQAMDETFAQLDQQKQKTISSDISNIIALSRKSPVSFVDRLRLSFAGTPQDLENELKKQYSIVQRVGNNYLIGHDPENLAPYDAQGLTTEVFKDLADIAGEIPVIAGQVIGTMIGAASGGVPAVAGAATGAATGQLIKESIGKSLGINEKTAKDIATDTAIAGAFGTLGEGLFQGAKLAKRAVSPKIASILQRKNAQQALETQLSPENTPLAVTTSRMLNYLAKVPEQSSKTLLFKYPGEIMNDKWFEPKTVLSLVDDTTKSLEDTSLKMYKELIRQERALVSPGRLAQAKALGIETEVPTQELFAVAKKQATDIGILNPSGRLNPLYPNTSDFKPVQNLLQTLGDYKDGIFISNPSKKLSLKNALRISKAFSEKYDGVSDNVQNIFRNILGGDRLTGFQGLRPRLTKIANNLGVEGYSQMVERHSSFLTTLERLKSLDTKNPGKIESFIRRLENTTEINLRDLETLQNMTGKPFLKEWELWNAAQDFNKANFDVLRFGSIAATLGILSGFDTKESQIGTLIGAGLLGTPAGLKFLIRTTSRLGRPMNNKTIQKLGQSTFSKIPPETSRALLSQLLRIQAANQQPVALPENE